MTVWNEPLRDSSRGGAYTPPRGALLGPPPSKGEPQGNLTLPKRWHQLVVPRPDFPSGSFAIPNLDAEIVPSFLAAVAAERGDVLVELVGNSDDYRDVADGFAAGPSLDHPVVAALWWFAATKSVASDQWSPLAENVIDTWVADASLDFAVEATHELLRMTLQTKWANSTTFGYLNGAINFRTDGDWAKIEHRLSRDEEVWLWHSTGTAAQDAYLLRLRRHLTAADAEARHAAKIRTGAIVDRNASDPAVLFVAAFLFPTESSWCDRALDWPDNRPGFTFARSEPLRPLAVTSTAQLDRLDAPFVRLGAKRPGDALPSLLEVFGTDLLPWLTRMIDKNLEQEKPVVPVLKDMITALTILGNDASVAVLVDRADNKYFAPVLQKFAEKNPGLVAKAIVHGLPGLPSPRRAALLRLLRRLSALDESAAATVAANVAIAGELAASSPSAHAAVDAIPALLLAPPWQDRKPHKPRVLADLEVLHQTPVVAWDDAGKWTVRTPKPTVGDEGVQHIDRYREWSEQHRQIDTRYLELAPIDELRPWIAENWYPAKYRHWSSARIARLLALRLELDAVPYVVDLVEHHPTQMREVVSCFGFSELAPVVAGWNHRRQNLRQAAQLWLLRFADHAVYGLVPDAVGADQKTRAAALAALRLLHHEESDPVARIAAEYGAEAAEIIADELAIDPMEQLLPTRMPKLPDFLFLEGCSLPKVADGSGTISLEAAQNFVLMLAVSTYDDPYPGVETVMEDLDRASTSEFMWQAFVAWEDAGYPARHSWILVGLGMVGDDTAVRRIAPMVRKWPHEGGAKRAQVGLDALGAMGGSLAMMELFTLSRKAKTKGLKAHAAMRVQNIADSLGLTEDELQDRLIPDLGLDERGTRILDYGDRSFTVGFDESLVPFVRDVDGKPFKSLPRVTKADDETMVKAAKAEFTAIKKEAKSVAADQLRRFEVAMTSRRRWSYRDFSEYFVGHPLMQHLVRRLVWGSYDDRDTGALVADFRLAEDGTFADRNDDQTTVPLDSMIGVVHPVHLTESERAAWGEILSDYELLQPFEQIARPVFELSEAERTAISLERYAGKEASAGRFLGLRSRGWTLNPYGGFTRPVGPVGATDSPPSPPADGSADDGLYVHLSVGGMDMAYLDPKQSERLHGVWVDTSSSRTSPDRENPIELGVLDAISFSELIYDLEYLFR